MTHDQRWRLTRRDFLCCTAAAGLSLALPGCAASPPLRRDVFPDFGDPDTPYLGLATSLYKEHDYEARVEGSIPPQLRGTFFRIGPGLFDRGGLRRRTILDGDGMVQSFTFHDKGVYYRSRFVRTKRYVEEEVAGRFLYPTWGTQAPGGLFANFWKGGEVTSQASVTVYQVSGRLYAFDEGSLPYQLDPVTLATVGETSLGLPRDQTIYAAHSKIDAVSGEWLHFGILFGPKPRLHITIFGRDGTLVNHRSFPLPRNVYMHDWFVTDRWLVFNFQPVEIRIWGFLLGQRSIFDSLRWNPKEGNLLMLVEREGNAPPLFMETQARFMWHSVNAYMNKGEIIGDFIGYDNPDHLIGPDSAASAIMQGKKGKHVYTGMVRRYVIDPERKSIKEELVAGGNFEWPRINEQHRCHRYRFAYIAQGHAAEFFWSIITRLDMTTGNKSSYDFGRAEFCSEPVFIPIPGKRYAPGDADEPGWLVSEIYDSGSRTSYLAILRAERIADGPVARIHLTHHVPFSYHGWWSAE
jgi:all-trans-8'-apo-beta-carotenal 15,15'-oxygenase